MTIGRVIALVSPSMFGCTVSPACSLQKSCSIPLRGASDIPWSPRTATRPLISTPAIQSSVRRWIRRRESAAAAINTGTRSSVAASLVAPARFEARTLPMLPA